MRDYSFGSRTLAALLLAIFVGSIQAADNAPAGKAATGTVSVASRPTKEAAPLSVFTNGIGKGMHAVYVHANFDALMRPTGDLTIYPKDKGQRIGNPLTMGLSALYNTRSTTASRPMATFENDKGPLMNPAAITLRGKLVDDVDYEVTFTFEKNSISVRGYGKDPIGLELPTGFHFLIEVPPYCSFPPDTPQTERAARLKGMAFITKAGPKQVVYPYASGTVMGEYVDKCWISGPVYGARRLSFEVKSSETAPMRPGIYDNFAPYNGYLIDMAKRNIESKKLSERLVLTIQ